MKRNLPLVLFCSVICFSAFGQSNSTSLEPKSSVRFQNRLESANIKIPETLKKQTKPDTAGTIVCLCCPTSTVKPVLFLIKRHGKFFVLDSLSRLNPNWIKSIDIAKEPSQTRQYGDKVKDGVVIITLNEDYHPEAYKALKHSLHRFRSASN